MNWLAIARELQAISQAGLHFTKDSYDAERYERIGQIAADLLSAQSGLEPAAILAWNRSEFGYPTPKVDVRGVVVDAGQVLLVSEAADGGRWALPGGWADVNESPSEAVAREVWEETGLRCRGVRLLGVLDREKQRHDPPFPYHVYKLFFHCEVAAGALQASRESTAVGYYGLDKLPELSVSRVSRAQLERFVAKIARGDLSTDFD